MKKFNTLGFKLGILSSLLVLGVISVMAHFIMNQARTSLIVETQMRAHSFARSSREAFLPKLDVFSLHLQVRELAGEKAVAFAMVVDTDGRILSHSQPQHIGESDSTPHGINARNSAGMIVQNYTSNVDYLDYTSIAAPIYIGNKRIGTVQFGLNSKTINAALARTRNKIYVTAAASVLAAVLGTVLIINWLTRPLKLLAQAARDVGMGKLDTTVAWRGSDEIGLLAGAFNEMVRGLRERDRIRRIFGRYVSGEIAETVLGGNLAMGGEKRLMSFLFADIRDSSKMSEKISPEEMVRFLNSYFSRMTKVISGHNGIVDKFIGDALLAIFGAPVPLKNCAGMAVGAALGMRKELAAFNEERQKDGLEPIRFGISINSGFAVAGNIGSEERAEYTVIGEAVNLAARLEGLNKRLGTDIIVSQSTYFTAREEFKFESLGWHKIRGWDEKVEVFKVLGAREG